MKHHKYQYVVVCRHGCGIQPLTEEQYSHQMNRPNSLWQCPACGDDASWDDECLETNPVEESPYTQECDTQLRNICLLFGSDPSDGEGTSPEEVYKLVKTRVEALRSLLANKSSNN